jgi:uncharacterized damage-inducible protein DinB
MTGHPYSQLVSYKQWADLRLYEGVGRNLDRLDALDAATVLRILDHMHVVDKIFQHHLQGLAHAFHAPRSEEMPDFRSLMNGASEVNKWYTAYVSNLPAQDIEQNVNFVFTNGTAGRMRRGEIILHICLHGTYHRGNAGFVLQKNGVAPNKDRMTDFLETAA